MIILRIFDGELWEELWKIWRCDVFNSQSSNDDSLGQTLVETKIKYKNEIILRKIICLLKLSNATLSQDNIYIYYINIYKIAIININHELK